MLKRLIGAAKDVWNRAKVAVMSAASGVGLLVGSVVGAKAEGTVSVDTSSVTDAFQSITQTVMTVIGAVALAAIAIFGIILAWKYGKKLFSMVGK